MRELAAADLNQQQPGGDPPSKSAATAAKPSNSIETMTSRKTSFFTLVPPYGFVGVYDAPQALARVAVVASASG
jgi:hypothetical protein